VSSRWPLIRFLLRWGRSNPATRRRNSVLPEPLSPSNVRNSPEAMFNEMFFSTLARAEALGHTAEFQECFQRGPRAGAAGWQRRSSLSGFDLVPDFVVLRAARNVLPEIDPLHVGIGVIEVQAFDFVRS